MKNMPVVIAAISQPQSAETVLLNAHARALAAEAQLVICCGVPTPVSCSPLFPQRHLSEALTAMDQQAVLHSELVSLVGRVTQRKRKEYTVVHPEGDDMAGGITRLASQLDASLVVMGPGMASVLVIRQSHCPVLVVRDGPRGCVLGASDLTDPGFPALTRAASEAREMDRPLCFFHALHPAAQLRQVLPAPLQLGSMVPMTEGEKTTAVTDARQQLRWCARELHTAADTMASVGSPGPEITQLARHLKAELIVIAARGRAGILHFLRNSVAESTILAAHCSVLVVRRQ